MNHDHIGRLAWWVAAVVTLIVIAISGMALFQPLPPARFVLATGPPGGAYETAGKRYQELLAESGVRVELRPTQGAVENLTLLNDPASGVSAGFVQSGTTTAAASPALVSLGAMFEEPLWFFCRCETGAVPIQTLRGRTMSIGPEGSGTRALALEILAMNEIEPTQLTLLDLPPEQAAARLLDGSIDAAAILTTWETTFVRELLASPNVQLLGFPRADAYVALLPYLDKLTIPMGVGNLALNRPDHDVVVIGTKASLAARKSLHPALQYLLIEAAQRSGGTPGALTGPLTFPAALAIDLPLSDEARSYYKSGPTFLQRYLPFWLAELAGRLAVGLLPLVGVLYPMWSIAPKAYGWIMRRRIYLHYLELKVLELEVHGVKPGSVVPDLAQRLDSLERRVTDLRVPAPFSAEKFQLKSHIALVARILRERTGSGS
jgi:TRAP-type uncharacterized transport system substrate-binding protein